MTMTRQLARPLHSIALLAGILLLGGARHLAAQQCPNGQCWDATGSLDIVNHNSTGNVGIGAAPGNYRLDVVSSTTGNALRNIRQVSTFPGGRAQASMTLYAKLTGQTFGTSDGFGPGIFFQAEATDTGGAKTMGRIGAVRDGNNDVSKLTFSVNNNGEQDRFVISNSGVSAIGVPLTATYADLAEWVIARGSVEPGTVVAIRDSSLNEVAPSRKAYDTSVAGVVSSKPGIVLGEAGEGKATVATTGRVKVKVDASSAPIRVGDLLVTSNREGFAMRSEPIEVAGVKMHRPGTLIGKALEPLEAGEGEILVLLSLQ